jgi:hypothetical protein
MKIHGPKNQEEYQSDQHLDESEAVLIVGRANHVGTGTV